MTTEELYQKVIDWDLKHSGSPTAESEYSNIYNQLNYHAVREWKQFLPADYPPFSSSYMERLANWIGNVADEEDQQLLLKYALYINFFSHGDFSALYRCAVERIVAPWIVSHLGLRLDDVGGIGAFQNKIEAQINERTWFCPVTDSMNINEFCHVNQLSGIARKPSFALLQQDAEHPAHPDPTVALKQIAFMSNPSNRPNDATARRPPLERLVLLEDIVGSGTQCANAVRWAASNLNKPVLFIPLILCPNGAAALKSVVDQSAGTLTVRPVIELKRQDLIGKESKDQNTWPISEELENLILRIKDRFPKNLNPFGFKSTGCSLVTFSNTPNNTLPIVHKKTKNGSWIPLFPRINRE
jgi:hypothetical protein